VENIAENIPHISGIVVDIILFFVIAGSAAICYKRGFARILMGILSTILAIVLVLVLYKPVNNYVINETKAVAKLEQVFEENLQYLFEENNIENVEQMQENENMNSILNVFVGDEVGNLLNETKEGVIKFLSVQISQKVVSLFVFFALFAIIRLLIYVIRRYIQMVAELPIIRVVNGTAGMIYGIIRGFVIIYAFFVFISMVMPIISDTIVVTAIQNAPIGSKMFNNNILSTLIIRYL